MSLAMADLPVSITDHRASAVLEIAWEDGAVSRLPHDFLRGSCRCAGCENARRRGADMMTPALGVSLAEIRPVADKGLNLVFSDGHERGIYPWAYLRELGDSLLT